MLMYHTFSCIIHTRASFPSIIPVHIIDVPQQIVMSREGKFAQRAPNQLIFDEVRLGPATVGRKDMAPHVALLPRPVVAHGGDGAEFERAEDGLDMSSEMFPVGVQNMIS
ncbi:hypothetical protein MCOR25_007391 [Pyricularia grisea]|nr:hypothetical protein MCOR25_007391 [Pyricularia grisea]